MTAPTEIPVTVTTMYGSKSRAPIVCLAWGDMMPRQMRVEEARRIAGLLLEAAESAEQDGFIIEWARQHGMDERQAALIMGEFRDWREQRRKA